MQRPTTRSGFTLVELLVVIAIISILVSLTMAAVQKVRERGREVQCRTDIQQLETAITSFKAKFGVYPPSGGGGTNGMFRLASNYNAGDPELLILMQMFPRIGGTATGNTGDNGFRMLTAGQPTPITSTINTGYVSRTNPILLDPNQCLVFFLSGGVFTGYSGFSTNPLTPFQAPSQAGQAVSSRLNNGPLYDFPQSRMVVRSNFTASYFTAGNSTGLRFAGDTPPNPQTTEQPWYTDPWGTPYLYFASQQGNDYNSTALTVGPWGGTYSPNASGVTPFYTGTGANLKFLNNRSTQIISAGRDQKIGPGGSYAPGTGVYTINQYGGDDYSNFQQTPLGVTD